MKIDNCFYIEQVTAENLPSYRPVLPPEVDERYLGMESTYTIGLREFGETAGAITGYLEENTFVLLGLYLSAEYRRRGGGSILLEHLLRQLPVEATVEVEYTEAEEGERIDMEFFLENHGFFEIEPEERIYLSTVGSVRQSALMGRKAEQTPLFADYSERELRQYGGWAVRQGHPCPPGGFVAADVLPELSTLVVEDGKVQGYIVVDHSLGGGLTVAGAYNLKNPKRLYRMLHTVVSQAGKYYEDGTPFAIPVVNDKSEAIVWKLMPDARQIDRLWIRETDIEDEL